MQGRHLVLFLIAACCPPPAPKPPVPPGSGSGVAAVAEVTLDQLTEGAKLHGFTAAAIYLDDADQPLGARFVHDHTGFTFDYLRIESAPQGFIWVNSFPTSDKGEPHTQEHLLLGKGDRGRRLGSSEAMALAESSAFTAQWRTAYHFHTVAGQDVFWPVFANQLDALLNPDYTDEEIRREVRNFGVDKTVGPSTTTTQSHPEGVTTTVTAGGATTVRLGEKGTVYNEMVRTYESPETGAWRVAGQLVYGAAHPLALDSGGFPDAIRTMTPADIRAFHDAAYHLSNMGMIGAFPKAMELAGVLDHTAAILDKAAGTGAPERATKVMTEADLPKPAPAAAGTLRVVDYPYGDTTNPGPLMLAWPASRALDDTERTLLGLFLDAFAGDESTTLYKRLIDSKTRTLDTGASGVWSMVSTDQGQPVYLGLAGVKADKLDDKTLADVRTLVTAELERIAKLPDGDPELVAFDARVGSRVVDLRRRLAKFLDTPPGFGFRGTSSAWMDQLQQLSRTKGFRKSLTMRPALAAVEKILGAPGNPWRDRLRAWGLLEPPFGVAARPSPALRKQLDDARERRITDELARLEQHYGTTGPSATLARYTQDYDAATKQLEDSAKTAPLPPLVASPPMTLDDGLAYKTGELQGISTFTATFDSMASARVQLAFRAAGAAPPDDEVFLAALPTLMSDAGVIDEAGQPITAAEMHERMRREILELSVYYTSNPHTGRLELVVSGAGNGAVETKAAMAWMRRVLLAPDWRIENVARLRDLVDQQLTSSRQRMLGAEEGWVTDPRDAWWQQQSRAYLHSSSFLTQAHDLHRLRWMLLDPADPKVTDEVAGFLTSLAAAKALPRAELVELAMGLEHAHEPAGKPRKSRWLAAATKLTPKARELATAAGKDLAALIADLPDDSLAADWSYLCRQMAHDLKLGAPAALGKLGELRRQIIQGARARLVEVGSATNQAAIAADVDALVRAIPTSQGGHAIGSSLELPLRDRLLGRDPSALHARFVGLVDPATSSGVFENLAAATAYTDTDDDHLLDYLASNLYTGHGAHSIFMKTWAAGLAYSNGLHPRAGVGVLDYYAERCPLLPQTLRFVIDELRKTRPDANIARYAVATAFSSRLANDYEARASAMAADLVDGVTPDIVRAFRRRVLELAKRADLAAVLHARMEGVYGKVLPGYGKLAPDGVYFVIGPEKQLAAYQDYLRTTVGKDAMLSRIYPRDFWLTASP